MPKTQTEAVHDQARGLDALPDPDALMRLLSGQAAALQAVSGAIPAIAEGAALMDSALRGDGRLFYAGAGSSALMACADGMELAGTFGIDPGRVVLCMAGGLPQSARMPGDTEDDTAQADADAEHAGAGDVAIVVTASGRTPYALRFAREARSRGAKIIAIANNPGAPIFDHADVAVCLPTPPELVAGSTRMGAGTAQKVALNMMSTLMGIRLGHIHDGMMVNLRADNDKLRARAAAMVADIAAVPVDAATAALKAADWDVKTASLRLSGAHDPATLLDLNQGRLRAALHDHQSQNRGCPDVKHQTSMENP